jgi:guanylate kinase
MKTRTKGGILFIISSPSGGGKTTLTRKLAEGCDDFRISVSYTTRQKRNGEKDGREYCFISLDRFKKMVDENAFAEYAIVHGQFYGTSLESIEKARKGGYDLLLDIDVQGAAQLRTKGLDYVSIFIIPPSIEELKRRLKARGTESDEEIEKRLKIAEQEMKHRGEYDYVIINRDLETAFSGLKQIIAAEREKRLSGETKEPE